MATPTEKSKAVDKVIKDFFGFDRKAIIESDTCVFCGKPATTFRDELSEKEYSISGICQTCQDETFK